MNTETTHKYLESTRILSETARMIRDDLKRFVKSRKKVPRNFMKSAIHLLTEDLDRIEHARTHP